MERGENGGVRFQVIRKTKVEKFKVDGDDFFPIVCSSLSPSTCAKDQFGDNFTKEVFILLSHPKDEGNCALR